MVANSIEVGGRHASSLESKRERNPSVGHESQNNRYDLDAPSRF
jgi:hypothetical protein